MKKSNYYLKCLFSMLLIIMLPICFAEEVKITEGVTIQKISSQKQTNKNGKFVLAQSASANYLFPGLASSIVAILSAVGIVYISIGAAVIVGGYLIYHSATTAWTYYNVYSYSKISEHVYKHINDFPNIWKKTPPSRKDFEKKCKDNMNDKSVERYLQVTDGRSVAYDPSTQMVSIGETDGKNIVTCYKDKDISSKTKGKNPQWKKIK